ncbi:MAG: hypothetical protein KQJ78_25015 [Deltaproteobacteria bacterium]|nr:hypothetical protein [Deltaproteobacteria bacterium]
MAGHLPPGLYLEALTPLEFPAGAAAPCLDREGFARVLARLAEPADQALPGAPAEGVVVAGPTAGQGQFMARDLWQETVTAALDELPPERPLVLGLTAATSRETRERAVWLAPRLADRPAAWGLDLALFHHSNRGLPGWLAELAAALGRGIVLMNQPDLVRGRRGATRRSNLMPPVLAKCAAGGGLAGVVYTGDVARWQALQRALRGAGPTPPPLLDGDENSFLARPAAGGILSPGAGLLPGAWRTVARYCLGGENRLNPAARASLLAAAELARELAGLLASRPAAVLAHLLHTLGFIAGARTLTPPAEEPILAAASAWARRALAGG